MPFGKDLSPDLQLLLTKSQEFFSHQCLSAKTCLPTWRRTTNNCRRLKSPMPFGKDLSPDDMMQGMKNSTSQVSPMPFGKDLSPDD